MLKSKCSIFSIVLVLLTLQTGRAQDAAKELVEDLRPALSAQTVGLVYVDLQEAADLQVAPLFKFLWMYDREKEPEAMGKAKAALERLITSSVQDVCLIQKLGPWTLKNRLVIFRCKDELAAKQIANSIDLFQDLIGPWQDDVERQGNLVAVGYEEHGKSEWLSQFVKQPHWLQLHDAAQLQLFESGLRQVHDAPVRAVFALSPDQKRAFSEMLPTIKAQGWLEVTSVTAAWDGEKLKLTVNTDSDQAREKIVENLAMFAKENSDNDKADLTKRPLFEVVVTNGKQETKISIRLPESLKADLALLLGNEILLSPWLVGASK